ncbi:MAG: formimidoylglutamate deiminase [Rhodospirillales bacterium]|jgi:formimidoylglutamate deiminase|nr:formimidoylglutamate deiminase [Rhodospirillales bacterium]
MTTLLFETALLPDGWANNVAITIDADGAIAQVEKDAEIKGSTVVTGAALPGMPNLHSHAFQRAIAGFGEVSGPEQAGAEPDSFWSWRKIMYGFLASMNPEDVQTIATKLYVDMLKAGYTTVGEFHYLHHDINGSAFADRAEMSNRVIGAAENAGIGITQLPVLYNYSGFGGQPANDGQRRFLNDADGFMDIVSSLHKAHADSFNVRVGIAPHSLRAATPELLNEVISALNSIDSASPIHIHIAEQTKEVDDCLAWSNKRPVEWLLDNQDVNERWCLIHATHLVDSETDQLAASGAVAGLCPVTEANLGDGLFPARRFMDKGGVIGIGSDSHISVNMKEELRWLEYGQRLFSHERAVLSGGADRSTGRNLYDAALAGGTQACGRPIGALKVGNRADIIVLDCNASPLYGRAGDGILDAWMFACDTNPVRDVYVGGKQVVSGGTHSLDEMAEADFQQVLSRLMDA